MSAHPDSMHPEHSDAAVADVLAHVAASEVRCAEW